MKNEDKQESNSIKCYPTCFYSNSIKDRRASYCSELNLAEAAKREACFSVRWTVCSFFSRKNCDTVIPKASHIFTREGMVGSICFLYQEEIVDCVSPECSASWYSVQWWASRNSVIRFKTFIIIITVLSFFVNYSKKYRCKIIFISVY